ncbi:unnamed protein product, partial [Brachionus calyciflorus]
MEKIFKNLSLNTNSPLRLRSRIVPRNLENKNDTSNKESQNIDNKNISCEEEESKNSDKCNLDFETSILIQKTSTFSIVDYSESESTSSIDSERESEQVYCESDLLTEDEKEENFNQSLVYSKEKDDDLVVTKTNRNNTKLIYNGNEYIYERKYKTKLYWRCIVCEPVQCKSRIHTNENFEIIQVKNDHFHPNTKPDKILSDIICNEIKERAFKTMENPRAIITDSLLKLPANAASSLPTIANLTQRINRQRKKKFNFGRIEKSLQDLEIKEEYKFTQSVLPFVPKKDTIKAFNFIKSISPKESESFVNYFEKTYIGLPKSNKTRAVPLFPIKSWNLHSRIVNDLPRSNNKQHLTECCLEQIRSGIQFNRDSREVKRDELLKSMYLEYESEKLVEFMD